MPNALLDTVKQGQACSGSVGHNTLLPDCGTTSHLPSASRSHVQVFLHLVCHEVTQTGPTSSPRAFAAAIATRLGVKTRLSGTLRVVRLMVVGGNAG
jgi:hypothetical protein